MRGESVQQFGPAGSRDPARVPRLTFGQEGIKPATGDFDEDEDVDLHALSEFQTCFAQSAFLSCHAGDLADSPSIDPEDFALLPEALTGPQ